MRPITPLVPAALPLWVLVYTLAIWGAASLDIGWQAARVFMACALAILGSCLGWGRGRGLALLGCALALGALAQARRAPILELPALTAIGDRRPDAPLRLDELLASAQLPVDAQWLCEGRVVAAPTAGEHGYSLQLEVTALRRVGGSIDWVDRGLPPDSDRAWLRVTPPMGLAVNVRGLPREPLWAGTTVRLVAALHSPRSGQNPGAADRPRHAAALGFVAVASIDPEALLTWLGPTVEAEQPGRWQGYYLWLARCAAKLRARLLRQIAETAGRSPGGSPSLWQSGAAVVAALALGERGPLIAEDQARREADRPTIEQSFRAAGIYHVLSVSGLHLAVVSFLFYRVLAWLLRRLRPLAERTVAHRIAALTAIAPTLFYALLTGAELATQRAAFAAVLGLLAIGCGRRASLSQALAGAVLGIASPCAGLAAGTPALLLCEPALILSIVATMAIAYLRPLGGLPDGLRPRSPSETGWRAPRALTRYTLRAAWRLAESSLAALLATSPIGAACFSEVQLAGVLGNLLPGLLGEFVVLPLGLLGACCGLLWPGAGALLLRLAITAAEWMIRSATAIASLGGVVSVPAPHPLLALAYWLGLVLVAARRQVGYLVCLGALAAYLLAWAAPPGELRMTVLDVGQGDAIVIEFPAGGVMVVDGGLAAPAPASAAATPVAGSGLDMGSRVVVPFLRRRGYRHIDFVVASHPHPDHIGGLSALIDSFSVGQLWAVPPPSSPVASRRAVVDPMWPQLLQRAAQRGIPIAQPRSQRFQGVDLEVLAPCQRDKGPGAPCQVRARADWQHNDNSLVLRLGYGGRTILLAGDIELAGELALLDGLPSIKQGEQGDERAQYKDLYKEAHAAIASSTTTSSIRADVLKVPHHCSRTSSSESFVAAVHPEWVICSVGAYNRFRFPHDEVTQRYKALPARVLRTDAGGAVTVRIRPGGGVVAGPSDEKARLRVTTQHDF